jgi:capsular polysaccharide biosynthesis protein
MDLLKRAWLIVKRHWALLVLPAVILLATVALLDALLPRQYTATATLFLRAPDVKTSASAYQGNLFTMQRANTYVEMMKSDELAQLIVDKLGLDMSAHELAQKVDASPVRDTVIIDVSVKDKDKQQAANLANTYGTEFATYVAKVEAANLAPDTPPLVTIVKPAAAEDAKSSLYTRMLPYSLTLTLALVLGLVIGVLLTWLAERYDSRIRSRQQIEDVTKRRVLGNLSARRSLGGAESVDQVFAHDLQFADEMRVLGINTEHALREVDKVDGVSVLAVVSADAGDGKSVIANGLASALSERGHRVGVLGIESNDAFDDRTQKIPAAAGRQSAETRPAGNRSSSEGPIDRAIHDLSAVNDLIILDPRGSATSPQTHVAATLSDAAVIIVRPGHTDEHALTDLAETLQLLDTPVIGVITNQATETTTAGRYYA